MRTAEQISIGAMTAVSALGDGRAQMLQALMTSRSGLQPNDFGRAPLQTWVGRVADLDSPLPDELADWDCRNNRLAWKGLRSDGFLAAIDAARQRYGAARVAVLVGSSTSSISATEDAYLQLDAQGEFPAHLRGQQVHTLHSVGAFVQRALQLHGPCATISTACSSSAKAFAMAERMLRLGIVDAAVVGGVDTLCGHVLYGFNALQLVSPDVCRPFDTKRCGINLGEAAGFALLQRAGDAPEAAVRLAGCGESSDAHHMSAPDPDGQGAERALDDALAMAGIDAPAIDYVHLHGTGTLKNDEVEGALLLRRFARRTHASSTKGMTGHTLGSAGILGAMFCAIALETGWMPGTVNCSEPDHAVGNAILLDPLCTEVRYAVANSFGFGGSNCVLVFARGLGR